jgi:drug/metabolite transporter superfamily protein YnfA
MLRRLLLIALLTMVHLALCGVLGLLSFAATMGRFDTGAAPALGERVMELVSRVLLFPVVDPLARLLPRAITGRGFPSEHLIFVANSLLWAVALAALWRRVTRRRVSNEALQPTSALGA